MPVQRLTAILRTRWRTAVAVWLGAMALAVLALVLIPAHYKAVSEVLVDPKTVDPAAGIVIPGPVPNHIPTEIDLIQSERVALRALHELGLQQSPEWRQKWNEDTGRKGDFEAWLAAQLLKKFDVRPSRDSNVLTLAFTSRDPEFSSRMANAFTHAYMGVSMELQKEPARESNAAFDETSKRLRGDLEQAQQRLAQFEQHAGLVATDERYDIENLRLQELSSQVVTLEAAAVTAAGRQRQGSLTPERLNDVLRDPQVTSITDEIEKRESRLSELVPQMGERHPTVVELRNSIGELRARAQRAIRRAAGTFEAERKIADERLAQARRELDSQRSTVLRLKAQRNEAAVLQRDVENAQRAYDAALTRASQTVMENRGARARVSVLKVATPPALPSWPNPWIVLGAAATVGLLAAIAAAAARESRDTRLRTLDDVTERLQQPVLVVLRRRPALLHRADHERFLLKQS